MTLKLLHHSRPGTIGCPFKHVNWGICVFNLIQIRAQSDHHPNRQKTYATPLTRCELMVPRGRVELPLSYENRILSPARLPVPPSGHIRSKGEYFLARSHVRVNPLPSFLHTTAVLQSQPHTHLIIYAGGYSHHGRRPVRHVWTSRRNYHGSPLHGEA